MLESDFSKKLCDALEGVGAQILNVHGHRYQKSGWPDVQVYHPKWTGHCELKVDDRKPDLLQINTMKGLLRRNTPAFVVRLRDNVVYCELWTSKKEYETLAYCHEWLRFKGTTRGVQLLEMFDRAGTKAIEIITGARP
jgi:hypothetical protein